MEQKLAYQGPIFDAHLHMVNQEGLRTLTSVENEFGIDMGLLIVHGNENKKHVCERYPRKYVLAKYFSGTLPAREGFEYIASGIRDMSGGGYHVAKMQSAPKVRNRVESDLDTLRLDLGRADPMFDALGTGLEAVLPTCLFERITGIFLSIRLTGGRSKVKGNHEK
ncbi:MAG: hypothetical protein ACOC3C_08065 [Candidatus Thorarchaeota archaeon]